MAIAEWVLPNGQRADYALFKGLDFYGIVEAKRWVITRFLLFMLQMVVHI
ncbi:MAG: hypothetical protein ACIRZI_04680 [Lactobacillus gallinarum]